jgi:cell division protein FtsQ
MARDNFYTPESGRGTTRPLIEDDDFSAPHSRMDDELLELHPDEAHGADAEPESEPQFLRSTKRVPVRKSSVTRKTANRLRVIVIAAALVSVSCATGIGLYHYATTSWRFRIQSSDDIETSGLHNVTRSQVMDVLGADIGRNIFRVSLEDRQKQLEEIPWVESATLMRLLPAELRINITERVPVAFVRIRSKVELIDANGVVMELPPHSQTKYSFPVLATSGDEPQSTLAARMKIFSAAMKDLDSGGSQYSKDISEVDLSDPDDAKITVEDPNGALIIHLGSGNYLDRYKIYVRHISEWRQQFNKLESVDLRFNGQVIVNADGRANPAAGVAPVAKTN